MKPYKTIVSSPAQTRDLTTLETVKQELGIDGTDSDAFLARMISEQSASAAGYCGRKFAQEDIVDYFRLSAHNAAVVPLPGQLCQPLTLSRFPVAAMAAVVEDGETLSSSNYELNSTSGQVWRLDDNDNRIGWKPAKIIVSYTAGFVLLTDLPREIERAVILMVKQAYYARTRDPLARAEDVVGVGRTEFWVGSTGRSSLPAEAAELLDQFIIPTIE